MSLYLYGLYTLLGTVTLKLINMKIWIHKADKKGWRKYWKPRILNTVGVELDDAKPIYRWLWWGYCA